MRRPSGAPQLLETAVRRGWIAPGAARAARTFGVPVLVVGVLVWLAATVLRAGGAGDPAPYAEFADASGTSFVHVQLDSSLKSYGAFSAVVPGQGRVWPKGRVEVTQDRGGDVELRYDGVGHRDPQVQPGPAYDLSGRRPPPEVIQLRLVAQIDADRHAAAVDVWIDGSRHRITTAGEPSGAEAAVEDVLEAVRTGDWDALYTLETTFMRNGSKRSDLVTGLANAGVITEVRAARTTGPTTYEKRAGVTYARTPIQLTYPADAGTTSVDAVLVLVVEAGMWRVLELE